MLVTPISSLKFQLFHNGFVISANCFSVRMYAISILFAFNLLFSCSSNTTWVWQQKTNHRHKWPNLYPIGSKGRQALVYPTWKKRTFMRHCFQSIFHFQLKQVLNHPWMRPSSNEGSTHIPQPPKSILYCNPVANENSVDPDVLSSMSSLGCFSDKDILISNLLKEE